MRTDVNLAGFNSRKQNKKHRMNYGLRKRKKLSAVQLFTITHLVHTSLLIYATLEIHLNRFLLTVFTVFEITTALFYLFIF